MIVVFFQQLLITSTENQPLNYRPSEEEQKKAVKTSVRTVKKFIQALLSHSPEGWGYKGEGVFPNPVPTPHSNPFAILLAWAKSLLQRLRKAIQRKLEAL